MDMVREWAGNFLEWTIKESEETDQLAGPAARCRVKGWLKGVGKTQQRLNLLQVRKQTMTNSHTIWIACAHVRFFGDWELEEQQIRFQEEVADITK